jgi:hypothetical protein
MEHLLLYKCDERVSLMIQTINNNLQSGLLGENEAIKSLMTLKAYQLALVDLGIIEVGDERRAIEKLPLHIQEAYANLDERHTFFRYRLS